MADKTYLTAPVPSKTMPGGIPYIIGNEAAERFSFYGMKGILIIFMTRYLLGDGGGLDVMSNEDATGWYHTFTSAVYFFPIIGAILSDWLIGKYKTILWLSVVYCLGHACLALDETRLGLTLGLTLIAIGSGGIKPCVSAHVGDQFGATNSHLLEKVFMAFYWSINLGAGTSLALTPWLLDQEWGGPWIAFGLPGFLMMLATIVFFMGRHKFVHIPPGGMAFLKETFSKQGLKAIGKLSVLYVFVAMFWALFDQTGSTWVLQAQQMDRVVFGVEILPSQLQAVNPVMVMILIPLCGLVIYPALQKVMDLTPVRKIGMGFFITIGAFAIPAWIESQISAGENPSILWQGAAYLVITLAEVFVSITALEYSYTQAPKKMKSIIMGFYLLSVSLGNIVVSQVNFAIQDTEVIGSVATEGEKTLTPKSNTTYALVCKAGESSADATVPADIDRTVKKEDGAAPKAKTGPKIAVKSFKAGGRDNWVSISPGQEVELSWDASDAAKCWIGPPGVDLATTGTRMVKPEKTTTFLLVCRDKDRNKAESKVQVKVNDGVAITDFTANGSNGTSVREGEMVTLKWKAAKADSCELKANTVSLEGASYYWFWTLMMFLTALLFLPVVFLFKSKTYIQDEESGGES